ncbi:hypothetical protein CDL15_Pgr005103 [Punica granatum]|uniref:Auxin-responsive protein n=1 Tax=Punica granatum TaxID=22663 RepID=A0A218WNW5_PUNGR|nr:hypothetical protein CDL15_Pgr005103 [Punica granatum]
MDFQGDANLKATELRLGLPGTLNEPAKQSPPSKSSKRASLEIYDESSSKKRETSSSDVDDRDSTAPPTKAQIVGWPPIRSYRKNTLQPKKHDADALGTFIKVSMDGAPYLRKIDLKQYKSYPELLKALEIMFNFSIGDCSERDYYMGSEYAPTYEDKDGDWMLVGDVPWK